jgi:hypothetical protein
MQGLMDSVVAQARARGWIVRDYDLPLFSESFKLYVFTCLTWEYVSESYYGTQQLGHVFGTSLDARPERRSSKVFLGVPSFDQIGARTGGEP